MITLKGADVKITPILESGLLETDSELKQRMKEVEKYLKGYKLKGPFQLNQFEILDEEVERAINKLIDCYNEIIGKKEE